MNSQKGEQVTKRYLKAYVVNYTFFIRKLPNRKPAKNTWYARNTVVMCGLKPLLQSGTE